MIRKAIFTVTVLAATTVAHASTILTENFDDISTLTGAGWSLVNNSTLGGSTSWFQGNTGVFDAQSGAGDSYIAANYLNAGDGGNVSTWLISPLMTLSDSTILTFSSRSSGFLNDSLQVRFSTNGASGNVGTTDSSVGDFTGLLASINPLLDGSYPTDWTTYSLFFTGVAEGTSGRFAFRYSVPDTFMNGDYIGIDSVNVSVPEPSTMGVLAIGLFAMGLAGLKRKNGAPRGSL